MQEGNKLNTLKGKRSFYLSQALRDKEKIKEKKEYLISILNKFKKELVNLPYQSIKFNRKGVDYYVVLPPKLEEYKRIIISNYNFLEDLSAYPTYSHEDKHNWSFYIMIEKFNYNRTHFENPLPLYLKGIGFGYKIYRKLADELGFISSDSSTSSQARLVWTKLISDDNLNTIILSDNVLVINKSLSIIKKKEIVGDFLKVMYEALGYNKLTLNKNLIIDNDLLKELGGVNLQKQLKDIEKGYNDGY